MVLSVIFICDMVFIHLEVYKRSVFAVEIWRTSVIFLNSTYSYGKSTKKSSKIYRLLCILHTISVKDSLTIGKGIEKSVFFFFHGQCSPIVRLNRTWLDSIKDCKFLAAVFEKFT